MGSDMVSYNSWVVTLNRESKLGPSGLIKVVGMPLRYEAWHPLTFVRFGIKPKVNFTEEVRVMLAVAALCQAQYPALFGYESVKTR